MLKTKYKFLLLIILSLFFIPSISNALEVPANQNIPPPPVQIAPLGSIYKCDPNSPQILTMPRESVAMICPYYLDGNGIPAVAYSIATYGWSAPPGVLNYEYVSPSSCNYDSAQGTIGGMGAFGPNPIFNTSSGSGASGQFNVIYSNNLNITDTVSVSCNYFPLSGSSGQTTRSIPGLYSAPSNLTVTPSAPCAATSIRLQWDKVSYAISYKIYRNDIQIGTASQVSTGRPLFNDSTVSTGPLYEYKVSAVYPLGVESVKSVPKYGTIAECFDYGVSVYPSPVSMSSNSNQVVNIYVDMASGLPQPVSISRSGIPSTVTSSLNFTSCTPSSPSNRCTVTLSLNTGNISADSTHNINITGSATNEKGVAVNKSTSFILNLIKTIIAPPGPEVPGNPPGDPPGDPTGGNGSCTAPLNSIPCVPPGENPNVTGSTVRLTNPNACPGADLEAVCNYVCNAADGYELYFGECVKIDLNEQ